MLLSVSLKLSKGHYSLSKTEYETINQSKAWVISNVFWTVLYLKKKPHYY